ncbi:UNVERIFIED_CONTAM: hypothetical protein GTU68_041399 [Idotea baltica]|nr:hypothetical protein [Idotea baltica]
MKVLSGYINDFEGDVHVDGMEVRADALKVKSRIGYLPEHNPLYSDMYVKEYLAFIARIYQLEKIPKKVDNMIALTGLGREQNKLIGALSKGYRQRVGLAQALIHDPEILILDEPTTGLDPNQLVEIRQLIKNIGQEKTVIFSSHIMQEVQALCDRVIIMHQGSIVADDKISLLNQAISKERIVIVELDRAIKVAWELPNLVSSKQTGEKLYQLNFANSKQDPRPAVFDFVVANGRKILLMSEQKSSMEDVFQKITAG